MPSYLVTDEPVVVLANQTVVVLANPTDNMITNCDKAKVNYSVFDVNSDCIYFNCSYKSVLFFGEIYKRNGNYYIKFSSISNNKWLISDGCEIDVLLSGYLIDGVVNINDYLLSKLHYGIMTMYGKISNPTVKLFC